MNKLLLSIMSLAMSALPAAAQSRINDEAVQRARQIVSKMTLEEKCRLIHGDESRETPDCDGFHILGNERLGIPAVRMADGPQGVRNNTHSTYYPCGISLAASWNRDVATGVGTGIGYDARSRGVGIMLCPGVNIYRTALNGRNFEYYGEDPYLASETAVNYIKGIQSRGVMATIKHFAFNNQEYDRHSVSSNVDERTANEIYFPTFRKAVEQADVACVMTSYNPVNGTHAAENPWLIDGNLRSWGFRGIVMSDWTSTYSTIDCVTGGVDLEMPRDYVMNYELVKPLVDNGVLDEAVLDRKCVNILSTLCAYGFLDNPMQDPDIPEDYELSRQYALAAALEGPVMLKNEKLLPLKPFSKGKDIVVLGPNADIVPFGGGSGKMSPIEGRNISLYRGLSELGKGYKTTLMDWKNPDWTRLGKATAVVLAVGFNHDTEGENFDRSYALPEGQDELIRRVAATNPNTVVVVYSGGEVDVTGWLDKVPALIMAWYPGQEGGTAMASILSGKTSPSGRLPFTFWGSLEKNPAYANYYVNKDKAEYANEKRFWKYPFVEYREGIFVGYRGVEHFGVQPLFPFGYGLGYSQFEYKDIVVAEGLDGFSVTFTLKNKSLVKASEVAQLYVAPVDSKVLKPARELKEYAKLYIEPLKSQTITLHLPKSCFSHYDTATSSWVVDPGKYMIQVGASSLDIRLEASVTVK
ncbi:MAG: glycoside hydrolase family 3 C-terminal domain-containing protein [Bacteroidales bacterium]|nr:glycoside hydrolase family 3 C-terminal domain-containing protein [Bacteroidales bacterium]